MPIADGHHRFVDMILGDRIDVRMFDRVDR